MHLRRFSGTNPLEVRVLIWYQYGDQTPVPYFKLISEYTLYEGVITLLYKPNKSKNRSTQKNQEEKISLLYRPFVSTIFLLVFILLSLVHAMTPCSLIKDV